MACACLFVRIARPRTCGEMGPLAPKSLDWFRFQHNFDCVAGIGHSLFVVFIPKCCRCVSKGLVSFVCKLLLCYRCSEILRLYEDYETGIFFSGIYIWWICTSLTKKNLILWCETSNLLDGTRGWYASRWCKATGDHNAVHPSRSWLPCGPSRSRSESWTLQWFPSDRHEKNDASRIN